MDGNLLCWLEVAVNLLRLLNTALIEQHMTEYLLNNNQGNRASGLISATALERVGITEESKGLRIQLLWHLYSYWQELQLQQIQELWLQNELLIELLTGMVLRSHICDHIFTSFFIGAGSHMISRIS